jgi:hypothetical protein
MKPFPFVIGIVTLAGSLVSSNALAQTSTVRPVLHVSSEYRSSYFDLHPELTKQEFQDFAGEAGSILRFRQLGDTTTLGRGKVDVSVQFTAASIDETKGAWNNTMSHPTANSYLGRSIAFPRLVARVGVTDRVELGAWGGFDPRSNYGMAGIDTKVMVLTQDGGKPVSVSIRPSVASLFGPAEVWVANASIDVSVGRAIGRFSPYVGFATTASVAGERTTDVNYKPVTATSSLAYAGVSYNMRGLQLSAEVEKGALVSYGFRIGKRF